MNKQKFGDYTREIKSILDDMIWEYDEVCSDYDELKSKYEDSNEGLNGMGKFYKKMSLNKKNN